MKACLALLLMLSIAPALAKEARTTIAVSCTVIQSSASAQIFVTTAKACGPKCVLKVVFY